MGSTLYYYLPDNTQEIKWGEDCNRIRINQLYKTLNENPVQALIEKGTVFFLSDKPPEGFEDKEKTDEYVLQGTRKQTKGADGKTSSRWSYTTCNWMGLFGYDGMKRGKPYHERLVIGSRFTLNGIETTPSNVKDYFLVYMLGKVLDIPPAVVLPLFNGFVGVYDLLWVMFPKYLRDAVKKGPYKEYVKRQYNDANVRGTIDVPRHIRQNVPFQYKIAYNTREFAYDNPVTQLIRHTIEYLKQRHPGVFDKCKQEVRIINEVTERTYRAQDRQKVIRQNLTHRVRSAYYSEYMRLQRLCLQILGGGRLDLGDGSGNEVYGILFRGDWLWETYLDTVLGGDYFYHPNNSTGEGKQHLFGEGKFQQEIYPDFIGKKGDEEHDAFLIADAKYKPVQNIGRDDYLQMCAYMLRFNAPTGIFIYPFGSNDKTHENSNGYKYSEAVIGTGIDFYPQKEKSRRKSGRTVIKLGFNVPDAKSYDDFSEYAKAMEVQEGAIREIIKTEIKRAKGEKVDGD